MRPDPPMRNFRPSRGIAANVAGASCGQVGPGHTRAVLREATAGQLQRALEQWRCACGRYAYGEDPTHNQPGARAGEPWSRR